MSAGARGRNTGGERAPRSRNEPIDYRRPADHGSAEGEVELAPWRLVLLQVDSSPAAAKVARPSAGPRPPQLLRWWSTARLRLPAPT
jgi:hypothetical protein